MPKLSSLTPRQRRFADEYLVDLNATQAAIRAGYSAKTAEVQGPRLLGNVRIAEAIELAQKARAVRTGITQDRVLNETALLAFSDLTHYTVTDDGHVAPTTEAPPGAMRAIQSIKRTVTTTKRGDIVREVEVRLWNKPGPLKLAGQHVGLFKEKLELNVPDLRPASDRIARLMVDVAAARDAAAVPGSPQ